MAHEIQALIGPHQSLRHLASFWSHAIVRELKLGLAIIPLTDELLHQILHPETEYDEDTAPRFHFPDLEDPDQCAQLTETLAPLLDGIIHAGVSTPIALIMTQYWAGEGNEAAVVLGPDGICFGPIDGDGAINHALKELELPGLEIGNDPFSTLGLDRWRDNDALAQIQ